MAIDINSYYYLFDPAFQIENNSGKPVVGGHIEVFLAGTDERVITYQDWDGTQNPFKIPLKSDGRAVILVEVGERYDAYVYDSFNNLVVSRLNILALSDASINGLTRVAHDNTLTGKGTITDPLKVNTDEIQATVHTQWPVVGNGSEENPITVNDRRALAVDDTMTAYNAVVEGVESLVLGVNPNNGYMTEDKLTIEGGVITSYDGTPFAGGGSGGDVTKEYVDAQDQALADDIQNEAEDRAASDTALGQRIDGKQDKLTAGDHIDITNNVISVTGLEEYAKISDIPSLDGYATEVWVSENYQKKLTAGTNISIDENNVISCTGGSGGKTYTGVYPVEVDNDANEISVDTVELIAGANLELVNNTLNVTGLDSYALKTDLPDVSDMATKTWVGEQGYLTEHQSLDGYATETWVNEQNFMSEDKLTIVNNKITQYDGKDFVGAGGEGKTYTGAAPIQVDNTNNVISVDNLTLQGGNNITLDDSEAGKLKISSKDWSADISTATDDMATKTWIDQQNFAKESDIPVVTQGANVTVTYDQVNKSYTVASKDWSSEIPSLDGYATQTWVTEQNFMDEDKLTIIDNKITQYDGVDFAGNGEGKTYTGEAPIQVNDTVIAVEKLTLAAGTNITLDDSVAGTLTINSTGVDPESCGLIAGSNITITENDDGDYVIASTGGGSSVTYATNAQVDALFT